MISLDEREIRIPGGEARAFPVYKGEKFKVIDVEGKQVADFIAFRMDNLQEFFSTAHSRSMLGRTTPRVGDLLFTNFRMPIFTFIEDTVGIHDTLFPCCDPNRYVLDFGIEGHRNCRENFVEAFQTEQIEYWRVPDPMNLFQNTPLNQDGSFGDAYEPISKPGDYVIFEALIDCLVGISACPQDMTPLCGWHPSDIHVKVSNEL